jgi:hypothetical protein
MLATTERSAMTEPKDGCVKPAGGPLGAPVGQGGTETASPVPAGEVTQQVIARVGHPAPDFEANAYIDGGFRNIRLSDYKGKWVALCFYPGDFTFV